MTFEFALRVARRLLGESGLVYRHIIYPGGGMDGVTVYSVGLMVGDEYHAAGSGYSWEEAFSKILEKHPLVP